LRRKLKLYWHSDDSSLLRFQGGKLGEGAPPKLMKPGTVGGRKSGASTMTVPGFLP
jgi:hypothetical protein